MNPSIANTVGLAVLGLWFVSGCANQRRPPGGPVDRTAPEIVQTEPESGAISVSLRQVITIRFSERMKRRDTEQSLHLFPAPRVPPEISWRGNELRIKPDTVWAEAQTYVVTLQGDARDAHGNALDGSFQMAFSTGDRIDSGRVQGRIFRNGRPVPGATALCYRLDDLHANPEFDTAAYVVLTDSSGAFEFSYLTSGAYRVYGLDDKDRDWLWNVGREWIGVPSEEPVVTRAHWNVFLSPLHLMPADTVAPEVTAAERLSDWFVRIELGRPADSLMISSHCKVSLNRRAGGADPARQLYIPDSLTDFFYAQFDSIGVGDSTIEIEWSAPMSARSKIGIRASDRARPPDDRWLSDIDPDSSFSVSATPLGVSLKFSIPLDQALPQHVRLQSATDTVRLQWNLIHPFLVSIEMPRDHPWDGPGVVEILPGAVLAAAGYSWPADTSFVFSLNAPWADSSGQIDVKFDSLVNPAAAIYRMKFEPISWPSDPVWSVLGEHGSVRGTLAEGDYRFQLLLDRDGDFRFDPGWPHPYRSSESLWLIADTLRVRARFTTELELGALTN